MRGRVRIARVRLAVALPALLFALSAPAGAKASLNAYFQSDFTDAAYQKTCFEKVLKSWKPPGEEPKAGSKTVVQSSIGRDGKLISALVTMKSGSKAWDEAALAAVRKASSLPPLPRSFRGPQVEVHWHFNALP